jgi:hypothetical protein
MRLIVLFAVALHASSSLAAPPVYRIDHVSDGDTGLSGEAHLDAAARRQPHSRPADDPRVSGV